jgi:transketolase
MRDEFTGAIRDIFDNEDFVFLTGDLGFGAFEELRSAMGANFINAGVAEQNMVSVASGLASEGKKTWVYSIGPFLYSRAAEQIRDDVGIHRLPVVLVGNGGGLGYGVMGPSHLAFDDYGSLLTNPGMTVLVPNFSETVRNHVSTAQKAQAPVYLRLGPDVKEPEDYHPQTHGQWTRHLKGGSGVLVSCGSLVAEYSVHFSSIPASERPSVWSLNSFPIDPQGLPDLLLKELAARHKILFAEEHVWQGGLGMQLSSLLVSRSFQVGREVQWRGVDERVLSNYGSRAWLLELFNLSSGQVSDWFSTS